MTMIRLAAAGTCAGAVLLLAGASLAGPEKVTFPADYAKSFTRYAEVDLVQRKVVRYYFTQPASLKAAKPGKPAPEGTVILMEDHKAKLGPDGNPMLDKDGKFIPEPEILALVIQEKEKAGAPTMPPTSATASGSTRSSIPTASSRTASSTMPASAAISWRARVATTPSPSRNTCSTTRNRDRATAFPAAAAKCGASAA